MTRYVIVTDVATEIPVMVTKPGYLSRAARPVMQRAGYSTNDLRRPVIVTDLISRQTEHDPFAWPNGTMRAFHLGLLAGDIDIRDGARVDVRALREAMAP